MRDPAGCSPAGLIEAAEPGRCHGGAGHRRVARRPAPVHAPPLTAGARPAGRHPPRPRRRRDGARPRSAGRDGERQAVIFLAEREPWLRRHLARQADVAAALAARGGARDGGSIPFRGRLHAVRVVPAVSGIRRSAVVAVRRRARHPSRPAERRSDAADPRDVAARTRPAARSSRAVAPHAAAHGHRTDRA